MALINTENILIIISLLEGAYPSPECSLTYTEPYELLVAARLAAQCTDERVNTVTPQLFSRYPSISALAEADIADVTEIIRSCGFYQKKAFDIIEAAKRIVSFYGGALPDTMEELLTLPGVGRKTANLILGDIFRQPAIVVDTHCIRLSNRIGLTDKREPGKIEQDLQKLLPPEKSNDFCHRLVLHGRAICKARTPNCESCVISTHCVNKNATM